MNRFGKVSLTYLFYVPGPLSFVSPTNPFDGLNFDFREGLMRGRTSMLISGIDWQRIKGSPQSYDIVLTVIRLMMIYL